MNSNSIIPIRKLWPEDISPKKHFALKLEKQKDRHCSIRQSFEVDILQSVLGVPLTELFLNSSCVAVVFRRNYVTIEFSLKSLYIKKEYPKESKKPNSRQRLTLLKKGKEFKGLLDSLRILFEEVNQLIMECHRPKIGSTPLELYNYVLTKEPAKSKQTNQIKVSFENYSTPRIWIDASSLSQYHNSEILQSIIGMPLADLFLNSSLTMVHIFEENLGVSFYFRNGRKQVSALSVSQHYRYQEYKHPIIGQEEEEEEPEKPENPMETLMAFVSEANDQIIKKQKELQIDRFLRNTESLLKN